MLSSQRGIIDKASCSNTVYSPIVKYSAESLYIEMYHNYDAIGVNLFQKYLVQIYSKTAKDSTKRE